MIDVNESAKWSLTVEASLRLDLDERTANGLEGLSVRTEQVTSEAPRFAKGSIHGDNFFLPQCLQHRGQKSAR